MIMAFLNQKGGVGKTTIALQLGAALARAGQRVLVVDLDPQASATGIVYEHGGESELTLADTNLAHGHSPFSEAIRTVERWGFDIAISDIRLAGAEQSRPAGAERR